MAWSSQTRPSEAAGRPAKSKSPNPERGSIILGFALFVVIGALVIAGIVAFTAGDDDEASTAAPAAVSTTATTDAYDPTSAAPTPSRLDRRLAEKACKGSIEQQLKDPDSADYRDFRVVEQAGTAWLIVGQVNANNSFGGKVGFAGFTCRAVVNPDQSSSATALLD